MCQKVMARSVKSVFWIVVFEFPWPLLTIAQVQSAESLRNS